MNSYSKVFEERNHYKALYEHERDVSSAEIKRLEAEIEKLQKEKIFLKAYVEKHKRE